jgi:hypothetical protein
MAASNRIVEVDGKKASYKDIRQRSSKLKKFVTILRRLESRFSKAYNAASREDQKNFSIDISVFPPMANDKGVMVPDTKGKPTTYKVTKAVIGHYWRMVSDEMDMILALARQKKKRVPALKPVSITEKSFVAWAKSTDFGVNMSSLVGLYNNYVNDKSEANRQALIKGYEVLVNDSKSDKLTFDLNTDDYYRRDDISKLFYLYGHAGKVQAAKNGKAYPSMLPGKEKVKGEAKGEMKEEGKRATRKASFPLYHISQSMFTNLKTSLENAKTSSDQKARGKERTPMPFDIKQMGTFPIMSIGSLVSQFVGSVKPTAEEDKNAIEQNVNKNIGTVIQTHINIYKALEECYPTYVPDYSAPASPQQRASSSSSAVSSTRTMRKTRTTDLQ